MTRVLASAAWLLDALAYGLAYSSLWLIVLLSQGDGQHARTEEYR